MVDSASAAVPAGSANRPELPFTSSQGHWLSTVINTPLDAYPIIPGTLTEASWLTADFYNPHEVILQIKLGFFSKASGKTGEIIFALYPQVRARLRVPGIALDLNSWLLPREGALLKPMCGGDCVLAGEVSELRVTLLAGPEGPVSWWQSPWKITEQEPPLLIHAESARRFLIDELGQSAHRTWPDKTRDETELISRLRTKAALPESRFPEAWTRWGGSARHRFDATGYFRTHHDGRRWWLVDPDGGAFWSTGLCCVAPCVESAIGGLEHLLSWQPDASPQWADARRQREGVKAGVMIDFLITNLIKTFGAEAWRAQWQRLAANFMRERLFNTIGNWSNAEIGPKARLPFTRPLSDIEKLEVPKIFRDLPDVYHPDFGRACAAWAEQLRTTRDDPAFIGYFICNEPNWSFAKQTPVEGMLVNTETAFTREKFAEWLRLRYDSDAALASAWDFADASFHRVSKGKWTHTPQSKTFLQDAEAYSALIAARLFDTLGEACKCIDPHHLNLGARFAHTPHEWMLGSLRTFDVFSFNSYSKKPRAAGAQLSVQLNRPVLIGEWHFGATDTGMPAAGLESVATQEDRGLAYRSYLEAHAAVP